MIKRFVACIYLKDGKAVRDLKDTTVVSDDPVALAEEYDNQNCDALMVFDMADSDAEKEQAIEIIREICMKLDAPVIGAGGVNRMEDVKKLLYAGCKRAALNWSKQGNMDILREVSEKFGKEKIAICYTRTDRIVENEELIRKYAAELILLDFAEVKRGLELDFPTILSFPDVSLDKLLSYLEDRNVTGMTGNAINDNISQMAVMKRLCAENGMTVHQFKANITWETLKTGENGLVPVVVQDYRTNEVLMVAYMDKEAYGRTIETGRMHYHSRSRDTLWLKGETSGHFQFVKSLMADCDYDTILARVKQVGVACHTGSRTCFFHTIADKSFSEKNPQKVLDNVYGVIKDRQTNPKEGSYTNYLFDKGLDKILKKVGEEATEMVIAAKNESSGELVYEMADFLYHMMVLMAERGISWEEITDELARR